MICFNGRELVLILESRMIGFEQAIICPNSHRADIRSLSRSTSRFVYT